MTAYNPPLYAFPNVDFNPAIYEQGATYTLVSSGSNLLTSNNTWTGTNIFSNVYGIASNLLDTVTSSVLSIGTSVANAISIGRSTFMTTILGNFTVNGTTTLIGASTAPTVTYPSNTTDIATTAYVTTAVAAGGGGGVSLSGNNTWTGTNNFSNALGVTTSWIDRLAAGTLSIGTAVANAISIGRSGFMTTINGDATISGDLNVNGLTGITVETVSAYSFISNLFDTSTEIELFIAPSVASKVEIGAETIPTNINGILTVGVGGNTIALNANGGLNRLLLNGSAGNNGNVLTSGGEGGSLSWGNSISLSGNNTWTGTNAFNAGISLGSSQAITCTTLPNANTSTATLLNTPDISFTFGATTTFNATKVGDTYVASLATNSPVFIEGADTSVMVVILQNTGVYMLSYSVRFSASVSATPVKTVQAYILSGTSANAFSIPYQCQYASNIQTYPSPFAAFRTTEPAFNGSTTAFINGTNSANNAVTFKTVIGYGSTNPAGHGCFIQGGTASNYMIITRIA
jgi:hypothetical protein